MKVITPGRPQKGWAREFSCTGEGNGGGGCGARLLVERDDLFHTTRSAMHDTDYFITFKCASCGVFTDIKDNVPFRASELPTAREWEDSHGSQ